jgi:thiol-disulfide isomerase/thioredoxin
MNSTSTISAAPMTDRRRFLMVLAGLAVAPQLNAQGTGMTPISAVPPAPTLRLPNDDGKLVDLAQYQGKVVLVNFWATWCPPCRKEFPSLSRVRKLFKPAQFEVVAVNVGEDPDNVFSFTGNIEFPVLFDRDSKTMAAWSVRGLPTTFLVNKQGQLAYRATGGREFDDPAIVSLIKGLL